MLCRPFVASPASSPSHQSLAPMKYALIIPDGCADEPQESLGGKTPLEAAHIPAMDAIAAAGVVGRANHTPEPCRPGPTWPISACSATTRSNATPAGRRWRRPPRESSWPRRLGRPLQSRHHRRSGDEELHGRPDSTAEAGLRTCIWGRHSVCRRKTFGRQECCSRSIGPASATGTC